MELTRIENSHMPAIKPSEEAFLSHARDMFPSMIVMLYGQQGGCSTTILVTGQWESGAVPEQQSRIIQFRPKHFALNMDIAQDAMVVHGTLVPRTKEHAWLRLWETRMQVLEMPVLPGVRFDDVKPRQASLDAAACAGMQRLLADLAQTFASSWHCRDSSKTCSGRVGSSIRERLAQLSQKLPKLQLRDLASHTLMRVDRGELDDLPIVLTHGDLLPSNMLVNEQSWALQGLVDWAEAEYLPFGMALYSVDHLLGCLESEPCGMRGWKFGFYHQARQLRCHFWSILERLIPELTQTSTSHAARLARDVGVLLWNGFAWDDGRIDRIVNEELDAQEIAYLDGLCSFEQYSRL